MAPWAWTMVRLWRMTRGGMGGPGHMLEAGGVMDQSPYMLECFALMSAAEHDFKQEIGGEE